MTIVIEGRERLGKGWIEPGQGVGDEALGLLGTIRRPALLDELGGARVFRPQAANMLAKGLVEALDAAGGLLRGCRRRGAYRC